MPSTADGAARPSVLIDTSVAVPAVLETHDEHVFMLGWVHDQRPGIVGHALLETYSVLTRLPPPDRLRPADAALALATNLPLRVWPAKTLLESLISRMADHGVFGGSVYDALVGATAAHAELPLATRDRRAHSTYAAMGVTTTWLGS